MLKDAKVSDAKQIADIYNHYIQNTVITFEIDLVTKEIIADRIEKIKKKNYPYIVYEENNRIVGYAYLNTWRERSAYNNTLETSIYLDPNAMNKGVGSILYKTLITKAKAMKIHALIGVVTHPNDVSLRLHEKFGFKSIGILKEVGLKFNKYEDVEFWQLIL